MSMEIQHANTLCVFTLIFLFSSGMPLLYLLGFIYGVATYVQFKAMSLKVYRKDVKVKDELSTYSIYMLALALVYHSLCAMLMLTNPQLTKTLEVDETSINSKLFRAFNWSEAQSASDMIEKFWHRFTGDFSDPHCVILLATAAIVIITVLVFMICISRKQTKPQKKR